MKTLWFGRFLIEVPEDAQVGLSQSRIDGFDIAAFDETREEFPKRVLVRAAQIRAEPDWRGGNGNLASSRSVNTAVGLIGKIFMHSRTVDEGTRGKGRGGVERYRHEGISAQALAHGDGINIDRSDRVDVRDPLRAELWMPMFEVRHGSTIRGASRSIGGIAGNGLVQKFTEDNLAAVYTVWQVKGTTDHVFVPHTSFILNTGKGRHGAVPSSLPDAAALSLWDKGSSSSRVRQRATTNAAASHAPTACGGAGTAIPVPPRH